MGPEALNQNTPTNQIKDEDPDPDLVADEPPFSDSSEEAIPMFRRKGTQGSGFNSVSEDSHSQQSARTSPTASVSAPRQVLQSRPTNLQVHWKNSVLHLRHW